MSKYVKIQGYLGELSGTGIKVRKSSAKPETVETKMSDVRWKSVIHIDIDVGFTYLMSNRYRTSDIHNRRQI